MARMAENFRGVDTMLDNLAEGATDGSYKKAVRDRGGEVESTTYEERRDLADVFYGIHETPEKNIGDGTRARTPNYQATPPWRLT